VLNFCDTLYILNIFFYKCFFLSGAKLAERLGQGEMGGGGREGGTARDAG